MDSDQFSFGRYRLDLRSRALTCDGIALQPGSRALDILCVLALAKGEVVSKDELLARVWRGLTVEDGNIHVHVSALRKVLDANGDSHVVTVPGRGYRLVGLQILPSGGLGQPESRQQLSVPDLPSIAV